MVSISIHFIVNGEQDNEESSSSPKLTIDDTSLVSDDCYTEGWENVCFLLNYLN